MTHQVQERLTRQLADAVFATGASGAMVVVDCSHLCMLARGVQKAASRTATDAAVGAFAAGKPEGGGEGQQGAARVRADFLRARWRWEVAQHAKS